MNDSEVDQLVLKCEAGDGEACFIAGDYCLDNNSDFEKALSLFFKAAEANIKDSKRRIGFCYFHLNNMLEARKYWQLAREAKDASATFNLGTLEFNEGNYDKAIALFEEAVSMGYEHFYQIGKLIYAIPNMSLAIKYLEKSYQKGDLRSIELLAISYEEIGERKKAKKIYEQHLKTPNHFCLTQRGRMHLEDKEFDEGIKLLKLACANGVGGACLVVGTEYANRGRITEAKEYLIQAITLNDSDALIEMGKIYRSNGKDQEALHYFFQALEAKNMTAAFEIGRYYHALKNEEEALFWLLKANEAKISDSNYYLGYIYLEKNELEKAKIYLQKVVETGERYGHCGLGLIEYRQGNLENAKEYYLKGIAEGDMYSCYNLAEIELFRGNADLGLQYAQKSLESHDKKIKNLTLELLCLYYEHIQEQVSYVKYKKLLDEARETGELNRLSIQ